MGKKEQISEMMRNYIKNDWVSLDILCQRAFNIHEYEIEENLQSSFPEIVDFKEKLVQVDGALKNMGYERYLDDTARQSWRKLRIGH